MKHVPLKMLEGAIIKPGFEKQLIPLLHFKGHANLGRVHRMWNLVVSMHEHECETIGEGLGRLQHNPDRSHLCQPERRVQNLALYSFLSRLQAKPNVANERAGMLDYARLLMPQPFTLVEVSAEANRNRHTWWRTFEAKMPAWRALQAERKAARQAARLKEREARAGQRAAAREERRLLISRQREALRSERVARQEARRLERERAAREPKKFVLRETSVSLAYPFLIHDGGKPEHDLLRAINAAVPRGIMGDLRADICQDIAVGVLCGDFSREDLALAAPEIIRQMRRMFPEKYGPLSLDAAVPGTRDLRLIDTI